MRPSRYQLVSAQSPRFYHCISRCVRQAFLCGVNPLTGQSLSHRRRWIEERLLELAEIFAVGVYAYAVMSNHVHLVLYLDPTVAMAWSAGDVAERWVRLCPARRNGLVDIDACRNKRHLIATDAGQVEIYRKRLMDLAWFMRCLNEPVARRANAEDECTGRFWEGRYKCQALLDDAAVLACMTYVDLNPIRAGIAKDLAASEYTSARRRIRSEKDADSPLLPLGGLACGGLPVSRREYIDLVDWTGRQRRVDKRGHISATAPPALLRLNVTDRYWLRQAGGMETLYWRAVGAAQALADMARLIGQCWLKGGGRDQVPQA
ncbi:transposase [Tahibacter amnicola]|uniref:Transposase n=1 Tax=Tahibacter amnicola TaxID=2976241 RepID=A0ABY6BF39_9GAMM|nr:transposase [Tahibacter amnicola]UXI68644.1 transposase [Tahibacter amnicola]